VPHPFTLALTGRPPARLGNASHESRQDAGEVTQLDGLKGVAKGIPHHLHPIPGLGGERGQARRCSRTTAKPCRMQRCGYTQLAGSGSGNQACAYTSSPRGTGFCASPHGPHTVDRTAPRLAIDGQPARTASVRQIEQTVAVEVADDVRSRHVE
jgi:hypothetical protein